MLNASAMAAGFGQLGPEQLRAALENSLPRGATTAEKIRAIEAGLRSPAGEALRDTMARWIVDVVVPVNALVPEAYAHWRPPVRDAMMFVVARLSPARLAPKLLEQIELTANTPAEVRLLRLIAKVPGLQKLGQVIARNQHLHPALRNALGKLENGIRDVKAKTSAPSSSGIWDGRSRPTPSKSHRRFCRRRASARWCDSPGAILKPSDASAAFSKS